MGSHVCQRGAKNHVSMCFRVAVFSSLFVNRELLRDTSISYYIILCYVILYYTILSYYNTDTCIIDFNNRPLHNASMCRKKNTLILYPHEYYGTGSKP